jgi:hypothetical protein
MTKPIDRAEMKAQTRKLLQTAQVSPKGMTALYCACLFLLSLLEALSWYPPSSPSSQRWPGGS